MLPSGESPESNEPGGSARAARRPVASDQRCPWCGGERIQVHKKMPSPRGFGLLAYVVFPIAMIAWLTTPTYNVCLDCGGRWQRGVHIEPRRGELADNLPEPEARAGMYGQPVPAPAVVRRRQRLGQEVRELAGGEVELRASPGACRVCWRASGRYDARDAPPVPVPGCVCEGGCRCELVPVDGEPSTAS